MNTPIAQLTGVKPVDPDLAGQAVPGHGIPSQDPDAAAQVGLSPAEAERESKSALIGGGLVAGLATGAAVGAAVAGPVGILVGGTVGAVAGVVGINAVGASVNPESTSSAVKVLTDANNSKLNDPPG
jgi:hypothetical protein